MHLSHQYQVKANWSFLRILRLVFGLIIIVQAIIIKDTMLGIAGLIFSLMAIFNLGCCGLGACNLPIKKNTSEDIAETNFEEVK